MDRFEVAKFLKRSDPPNMSLQPVDAASGLPSLALRNMHTVGRENTDLILTHSKFAALASRKHAVIQLLDGVWKVSDQASLNGLFVNGVRVAEQVLNNGDTVIFGHPMAAKFPLGSVLPNDKWSKSPYCYKFYLHNTSQLPESNSESQEIVPRASRKRPIGQITPVAASTESAQEAQQREEELMARVHAKELALQQRMAALEADAAQARAEAAQSLADKAAAECARALAESERARAESEKCAALGERQRADEDRQRAEAEAARLKADAEVAEQAAAVARVELESARTAEAHAREIAAAARAVPDVIEIMDDVENKVTDREEELRESLMCCICQELMVFAVVLPECGHWFCQPCIDQWKQARGGQSTCPSCRHNMRQSATVSAPLRSMCDSFAATLSEDDRAAREARRKSWADKQVKPPAPAPAHAPVQAINRGQPAYSHPIPNYVHAYSVQQRYNNHGRYHDSNEDDHEDGDDDDEDDEDDEDDQDDDELEDDLDPEDDDRELSGGLDNSRFYRADHEDFELEIAPSGRAACRYRRCQSTIAIRTVRVARYAPDSFRGGETLVPSGYLHPQCFRSEYPNRASVPLSCMNGYSRLTQAQKDSIRE